MRLDTTTIVCLVVAAILVGWLFYFWGREDAENASGPAVERFGVGDWPIVLPEPELLRIHRRDEDTIEGIFLGFKAGHYRLANAKLLHDDETRTVLDGETWVPRADVLLAQVIS